MVREDVLVIVHFVQLHSIKEEQFKVEVRNLLLKKQKKWLKWKILKGYIHDVGGPTANFRKPACKHQLTIGACKTKQCLSPGVCKNMEVDHKEFVDVLRSVRSLPKVKRYLYDQELDMIM